MLRSLLLCLSLRAGEEYEVSQSTLTVQLEIMCGSRLTRGNSNMQSPAEGSTMALPRFAA